MKIGSVFILAVMTLLATCFIFSFNGCSEQAPPLAQENEKGQDNADNEETDVSSFVGSTSIPGYPQEGSHTYLYNSSAGYEAGNVETPNGSILHVERNALIPPPDIPAGEPVIINMLIEIDSTGTKLRFSFEPSGTSFNPPAELRFDWSDLKADDASLYLIDETGNYILQEPDDVDIKGKRFKVFIDHFSRYVITKG